MKPLIPPSPFDPALTRTGAKRRWLLLRLADGYGMHGASLLHQGLMEASARHAAPSLIGPLLTALLALEPEPLCNAAEVLQCAHRARLAADQTYELRSMRLLEVRAQWNIVAKDLRQVSDWLVERAAKGAEVGAEMGAEVGASTALLNPLPLERDLNPTDFLIAPEYLAAYWASFDESCERLRQHLDIVSMDDNDAALLRQFHQTLDRLSLQQSDVERELQAVQNAAVHCRERLAAYVAARQAMMSVLDQLPDDALAALAHWVNRERSPAGFAGLAARKGAIH